jgi:hypothetical protein
LEAAAGNPVIYWARNNLYVFDRSHIYHMDTTLSKPSLFGPYLDALCLVDTSEGSPSPYFLLLDTRLFVIQATSDQKGWTEERDGILEFVLNPPDEAEMIQASVYSLLHYPP